MSLKYDRHISPCESEGICFTGVGMCVCLFTCVCVSVCLSVTTITKKIVDGFYQILREGS